MKDQHNSPVDDLKKRRVNGEIDDAEYNKVFKIVSLEHTWIKPWINEWLPMVGALAFGSIVGAVLQQVLASSSVDSKLLASIVGIIGGGAVTALFPARSLLFGSYSIGLAIGFFLIPLSPLESKTNDAENNGAHQSATAVDSKSE